MLSVEVRAAIVRLAEDIPALWKADTTTAADRQMIARQLIERVVVTVIDDSEKVQVEVYWIGGHITRAIVIRPVARMDQMSDYRELLQRVKALHSQGD
ncbi:MAG TPA: recombinase family protein, partial [Chromatiaceae bacterium]|nr:recombinase family protein [Chromatiaceae bacterium]